MVVFVTFILLDSDIQCNSILGCYNKFKNKFYMIVTRFYIYCILTGQIHVYLVIYPVNYTAMGIR